MFSHELKQFPDYVEILMSGTLVGKYEAKSMEEELDQIALSCPQFLVNLRDLTYMNSEGFNVLLHILTKARTANGEAVLLNISAHLQELLIMTKLNHIFTVAESREEAIAILEKGR
jgi:anti-sigma B factor antagonist